MKGNPMRRVFGGKLPRRVIEILEDLTLGNWFDQDVRTTASPTFANLTITVLLTAASIVVTTLTAINAAITSLTVSGSFELIGDGTVFEDLQVGISNIKKPAAGDPADRLYAHGIGGGVTFPVLGFAVDEYIYFDVQTHHAMKLSTVLDNHIHYTTPTDGTGDRFQFQLDVIAAAINVAWAVPTGSPFTKETTMSGDYSTLHKLTDIADIPAANTTVSTLYKCVLTRIAATQDEYAGEVYLEFTDCHYEKNTMGSATETAK